jgi:hypothetical protein
MQDVVDRCWAAVDEIEGDRGMVTARRLDFLAAPAAVSEPLTKLGGQPVWLDTPQWPLSAGRQVTCPRGQISQGWHGPYPTSSPTAAPLIVARFTKSQCQPCPDRPRCASSRENARNVGFPPRELRDLQIRVRSEQQTPEWKARYAVRSGVEGTINEFAHGHGMRRCRYRGQPKAHLQHVLTAIAVNIERLSGRSVTEEASSRRPPTAFHTFLDQQGIPRPKS